MLSVDSLYRNTRNKIMGFVEKKKNPGKVEKKKKNHGFSSLCIQYMYSIHEIP